MATLCLSREVRSHFSDSIKTNSISGWNSPLNMNYLLLFFFYKGVIFKADTCIFELRIPTWHSKYKAYVYFCWWIVRLTIISTDKWHLKSQRKHNNKHESPQLYTFKAKSTLKCRKPCNFPFFIIAIIAWSQKHNRKIISDGHTESASVHVRY